MRVAIEASTWINPRGYGRFTREITRALLRAGSSHEFTLVVDSGAARARDLPEAPIVVVPTKEAVVDAATAEGARSPIDMARMALRLSRGFDAVLFPTNYSFVPPIPGPFVIVVIHDAMPETLPNLVLQSRRDRALWNLKTRLVRARANLIATVSEASAGEIRRHLGVKDLLVLTEGVSPIFSPQPRPSDDDRCREVVGGPDRRFVLYVGGLSPHKRVPELVRAFGAVAATAGNENLRLVLAGPGEHDQFTADRSGVAEAIAALGPLGARVIRSGFVSDDTLAALYRGADCCVLPSLVEGFGLPALEAMASGAPLIVSRTPALEELCGDAADYVDALDRLPIVLSQLLADGSRRQRLRALGLGRAQGFGWDEAARRLLTALTSVPAGARRSDGSGAAGA